MSWKRACARGFIRQRRRTHESDDFRANNVAGAETLRHLHFVDLRRANILLPYDACELLPQGHLPDAQNFTQSCFLGDSCASYRHHIACLWANRMSFRPEDMHLGKDRAST